VVALTDARSLRGLDDGARRDHERRRRRRRRRAGPAPGRLDDLEIAQRLREAGVLGSEPVEVRRLPVRCLYCATTSVRR
jgi:hypothetical protein